MRIRGVLIAFVAFLAGGASLMVAMSTASSPGPSLPPEIRVDAPIAQVSPTPSAKHNRKRNGRADHKASNSGPSSSSASSNAGRSASAGKGSTGTAHNVASQPTTVTTPKHHSATVNATHEPVHEVTPVHTDRQRGNTVTATPVPAATPAPVQVEPAPVVTTPDAPPVEVDQQKGKPASTGAPSP